MRGPETGTRALAFPAPKCVRTAEPQPPHRAVREVPASCGKRHRGPAGGAVAGSPEQSRGSRMQGQAPLLRAGRVDVLRKLGPQ